MIKYKNVFPSLPVTNVFNIGFKVKVLICLFIALISSTSASSQKTTINNSLGLYNGATFFLFPNSSTFGIHYFQAVKGNKKQSLGLKTQFFKVTIPDIETKYLFTTAAQFNYFTHRRIHGAMFLGLNYQLRNFEYPNYNFTTNGLTETNKRSHIFGPTWGSNIALKVISKKRYSIDLFLDYTRLKLNKSYTPNPFNGFKSIYSIGLAINKSKT